MSVVEESLRKIAKEIEFLSFQTQAFVSYENPPVLGFATTDPDIIRLYIKPASGAFKNVKPEAIFFSVTIDHFNHMQATAFLAKLKEIKKHD